MCKHKTHKAVEIPLLWPQKIRQESAKNGLPLWHVVCSHMLRIQVHVYNQWTQFEEFPKFMEGVKEVRQLDDKRLNWVAEIGGKEKQWTARIIDQIPDHRIAWESESGEFTSGVVTFQTLADDRTRINLEISYDPKGFVENAGDALGVVSRRIENDLERFKEFIEHRGQETGAWRGTIRDSHKSV